MGRVVKASTQRHDAKRPYVYLRTTLFVLGNLRRLPVMCVNNSFSLCARRTRDLRAEAKAS